jgi:hypothetical protein
MHGDSTTELYEGTKGCLADKQRAGFNKLFEKYFQSVAILGISGELCCRLPMVRAVVRPGTRLRRLASSNQSCAACL